jgi:DNA-binding transcriptional LysR family regulator
MPTASLVACANWDLFRLFFVVARMGSMNRAATHLGISQPTLSRRLGELERSLGAPLLFRGPSGIVLTQEGEALRHSASNMMLAFDTFQKEFQEHIGTRSSLVKISASEGMTKHWLLPRLKRLRESNDKLQFEVHSTAAQQSLAAGDLDFVIRIGHPGDGELVGRRVGKIAFGIYASQEYLQCRRAPQSINDLESHALIGHIPSAPHSRRDNEAGSDDLISRFHAASAMGAVVKLAQVSGQVAATSAGLGLALLAVPFAEAEGLSRVLPSEEATLDLWLLRRRESDLRRQARQIRQFLECELDLAKDWLAGRRKLKPYRSATGLAEGTPSHDNVNASESSAAALSSDDVDNNLK